MGKDEDWKTCRAQVKDGKASCKVGLFKELEAGGSKKAYCVLVDAAGKRLTSPYWSAIMNAHKAKPAAKDEEEDEEEEEEKEKKEDKEEEKKEKKRKEDKE